MEQLRQFVKQALVNRGVWLLVSWILLPLWACPVRGSD